MDHLYSQVFLLQPCFRDDGVSMYVCLLPRGLFRASSGLLRIRRPHCSTQASTWYCSIRWSHKAKEQQNGSSSTCDLSVIRACYCAVWIIKVPTIKIIIQSGGEQPKIEYCLGATKTNHMQQQTTTTGPCHIDTSVRSATNL